jgi:4-azaleucine resistance transporter AzlC
VIVVEVASDRELGLNEFWTGLKAPLPLAIGVMSFGLAYGILVVQARLSFFESALMSMTVFAGAAQFVGTGMLMSGAGALPILVTTFMINSRHFLMSASLAPYARDWRLRWKVLLSFLLADETYALTMSHFSKNVPSRYYQLGVGLSVYAVWLVSSIVGSAVGPFIGSPQTWGLDFALPATFIALVIPMLQNYRDVLVCTVAGFLSVAFFTWFPGNWHITFASIVAVMFGWGLVEVRKRAFWR